MIKQICTQIKILAAFLLTSNHSQGQVLVEHFIQIVNRYKFTHRP